MLMCVVVTTLYHIFEYLPTLLVHIILTHTYVNLPSLPDKILLAVSALLSDERPLWIGSADALVKATGLEMSPNALSRYLGSHVTELKKEYFIDFSKGRTNSGRSIRLMYGEDKPLTKESINDMNEGERDSEKECI